MTMKSYPIFMKTTFYAVRLGELCWHMMLSRQFHFGKKLAEHTKREKTNLQFLSMSKAMILECLPPQHPKYLLPDCEVKLLKGSLSYIAAIKFRRNWNLAVRHTIHKRTLDPQRPRPVLQNVR